MEYHCDYCMCPEDYWEPTIKNYQGDECKLFDTFFFLIEDWMTPGELTKVAKVELPKEYYDIEDLDALVKELVDIAIECGLIRDPNHPAHPPHR